MQDPDDVLSTINHALRAARRRRVIDCLADTDEQVWPVRRLAREITAREKGIPLEQATGEPYRNVYNALSQTHLPTLQAASIIIYDPKRQTVSTGPDYELLVLLLALERPTIELFNQQHRKSN